VPSTRPTATAIGELSMARSINCLFWLTNMALDKLFLIVIQVTLVIALGKFICIHVALHSHNLPCSV
jgi:hypothetical protein